MRTASSDRFSILLTKALVGGKAPGKEQDPRFEQLHPRAAGGRFGDKPGQPHEGGKPGAGFVEPRPPEVPAEEAGWGDVKTRAAEVIGSRMGDLDLDGALEVAAEMVARSEEEGDGEAAKAYDAAAREIADTKRSVAAQEAAGREDLWAKTMAYGIRKVEGVLGTAGMRREMDAAETERPEGPAGGEGEPRTVDDVDPEALAAGEGEGKPGGRKQTPAQEEARRKQKERAEAGRAAKAKAAEEEARRKKAREAEERAWQEGAEERKRKWVEEHAEEWEREERERAERERAERAGGRGSRKREEAERWAKVREDVEAYRGRVRQEAEEEERAAGARAKAEQARARAEDAARRAAEEERRRAEDRRRAEADQMSAMIDEALARLAPSGARR